ncbi:selenoprotein B glycine/betaine/sarcosine/D-proline reductase [Candidatus Entotheonella serta]|nr:selenoprotein B glycine/betaine/sarcosine/D-proline reductase [Candidatus Entotheonella serta]
MPLPSFEETPWAGPLALTEARVAIVTTAAINRADDRPFTGHDGSYRLIPGEIDYRDLVMTHSSVNFDRGAFHHDVNIAFPLEHLRTLAAAGEIGSVASWHYSFMGSTTAERMEPAAREVASRLSQEAVNLVLLIPI